MDVERILRIAERLLHGHVRGIRRLGPCRLGADVDACALLTATRMLVNTEWGYLAAITGRTKDPGGDELEINYHFSAGETVVTLRLCASGLDSLLPSVSGIVPFAGYFEDELSEALGIVFERPPVPPALLTSERGWGGISPLRGAPKP